MCLSQFEQRLQFERPLIYRPPTHRNTNVVRIAKSAQINGPSLKKNCLGHFLHLPSRSFARFFGQNLHIQPRLHEIHFSLVRQKCRRTISPFHPLSRLVYERTMASLPFPTLAAGKARGSECILEKCVFFAIG